MDRTDANHTGRTIPSVQKSMMKMEADIPAALEVLEKNNAMDLAPMIFGASV